MFVRYLHPILLSAQSAGRVKSIQGPEPGLESGPGS
jgi:hypothetical protein